MNSICMPGMTPEGTLIPGNSTIFVHDRGQFGLALRCERPIQCRLGRPLTLQDRPDPPKVLGTRRPCRDRICKLQRDVFAALARGLRLEAMQREQVIGLGRLITPFRQRTLKVVACVAQVSFAVRRTLDTEC